MWYPWEIGNGRPAKGPSWRRKSRGRRGSWNPKNESRLEGFSESLQFLLQPVQFALDRHPILGMPVHFIDQLNHGVIGPAGGTTITLFARIVVSVAGNVDECPCRFQVDPQELGAGAIHSLARSPQLIHGRPGRSVPPNQLLSRIHDSEVSPIGAKRSVGSTGTAGKISWRRALINWLSCVSMEERPSSTRRGRAVDVHSWSTEGRSRSTGSDSVLPSTRRRCFEGVRATLKLPTAARTFDYEVGPSRKGFARWHSCETPTGPSHFSDEILCESGWLAPSRRAQLWLQSPNPRGGPPDGAREVRADPHTVGPCAHLCLDNLQFLSTR